MILRKPSNQRPDFRFAEPVRLVDEHLRYVRTVPLADVTAFKPGDLLKTLIEGCDGRERWHLIEVERSPTGPVYFAMPIIPTAREAPSP
jgi:hypothetical protein